MLNRTIAGTGDVEISGAVANGNLFSNGLIYSGTGTLAAAGQGWVARMRWRQRCLRSFRTEGAW